MRQSESKSTQKGGAGLRQPMISSFFSQPSKGVGIDSEPLSSSSSPIDLTISDDEEPPAKKQKRARRPTPDSSTQRRPQSPHTPASRWRYVPSQSPEKPPVDPETKKRRELFAKQLLAKNSSFVGTAGADGHDLPSDHADGEPDSSGAGSDSEFKHLQELFARKTEQKKKRRATQERSSKKQTELGPSGEPYTALELQVWCSSPVGA
jgi:DNA mismatch repair protein MSH3